MSKFLKALAKVGLVELDAEQARALETAVDADEARRIVAEARGRPPQSAEASTDALTSSGASRSGPRVRGGAELHARSGPSSGPTSGSSSSDAGSADALSRAAHGRAGSGSEASVDAGAGFSPDASIDSGIEEGRPFETLYAAASLPAAPFSAEKLLRVLDGLRAMDAATRKAAILAMDAADDEWTIDDPILDAERKTRVLEGEQQRLGQVVRDGEARGAQELDEITRYEQEATDTIRKQIADLEALLGRELAKGAEERANSHARLRATKEACTRESSRLDQEILRLRTIALTFQDPIARENEREGN